MPAKIPILIWAIDDTPENLTIHIPNFNKARWVALIPPHYQDASRLDDLQWLIDACSGGAKHQLVKGPEGAILLVWY